MVLIIACVEVGKCSSSKECSVLEVMETSQEFLLSHSQRHEEPAEENLKVTVSLAEMSLTRI